MPSIPQTISRRSFLISTAACAMFPLAGSSQEPIERGIFSEQDIPLMRERLLNQLNDERARAGLSQLQLDELACRVASEHARDMVNRDFLSHWGSDGRKPYHRYSFAGGVAAVQENVSSADNIQSVSAGGVANDLHDMHLHMEREVPPNDGHRKTIYFPRHTHVGFGIALANRSLRLDELYLAKYVEIAPIVRTARPKTRMIIDGKLLNRAHVINGAEVYFEPWPEPPALEWLRIPRSYGMPHAAVEAILPRLPNGYMYMDGSTGSIQRDHLKFRIPFNLNRQPGINTVLIWLKENENGIAFPAAQICIRGV